MNIEIPEDTAVVNISMPDNFSGVLTMDFSNNQPEEPEEPGMLTIDTTPDTFPEYLVEGPAFAPTATAAISFKTNEGCDIVLRYGETPEYGEVFSSYALEMDHELVLEGLKPDTMYYYQITAVDEHGNRTVSPQQTLRTSGK